MDNRIQLGLSFLEKEQQSDGSFLTFSSSSNTFTSSISFHSTFSTSLILQSLSTLPFSHQQEAMVQKATAFLLSQKSPHWSWNYWTRQSKETKTMPYPDDLDDTFCAAAALYKVNTHILDGTALAQLVTLLTVSEIKEGGPYRTWLVPPNSQPEWVDVDPVVNANIGYFLSLHDISLPNLESFFDNAIMNKTLTSPYYPTLFPLYYFLSRWYQGKHKDKLITLFRKQKVPTNIPLFFALHILTAFHLKLTRYPFETHLKTLIQHQKPNGSWDIGPFYTGVNPKRDSMFFAGSKALTTAFCLHALSLPQQHQPTQTTQTTSISNTIVTHVTQTLQSWSGDGYTSAKPILDTLLTGTITQQLVLLPTFFWNSLDKKLQNSIKNPQQFLSDLGSATCYGWIAYTIYDNILDNEGNPTHLSIANVCLRELTRIFTSSIAHIDTLSLKQKRTRQDQFTTLFTSIMNTLDNANQWEVMYARCNPNKSLHTQPIPSFREFAAHHSTSILTQTSNIQNPKSNNVAPPVCNRSLGHALGPLAILFALGFTEKSPTVKHTIAYFQFYLSARQLNDDAHDWEDDISKGHITAVSSFLLQQLPKRYSPQYYLKTQKLQSLFWNHSIIHISQTIRSICQQGHKALSHISALHTPSLWSSLIEEQEHVAEEALTQRTNIKKFLKEL